MSVYVHMKCCLINSHLPKNMEIKLINLIKFGESFPLHKKKIENTPPAMS